MKRTVSNLERGKFKHTLALLVKQIDRVKNATTKMIQLRIDLEFGIQKPTNVVLLTGITCSRLFQFFATKEELKKGMDMVLGSMRKDAAREFPQITEEVPSFHDSVEASWKIIQAKNKDKSKKKKRSTAEEKRLAAQIVILTRQRDETNHNLKRIMVALKNYHEAEEVFNQRKECLKQEMQFVQECEESGIWWTP